MPTGPPVRVTQHPSVLCPSVAETSVPVQPRPPVAQRLKVTRTGPQPGRLTLLARVSLVHVSPSFLTFRGAFLLFYFVVKLVIFSSHLRFMEKWQGHTGPPRFACDPCPMKQLGSPGACVLIGTLHRAPAHGQSPACVCFTTNFSLCSDSSQPYTLFLTKTEP